MNDNLYIDKKVFLEQLKYLKEAQEKTAKFSWDYIRCKDIEWFIKMVEDYPKCDYSLFPSHLV